MGYHSSIVTDDGFWLDYNPWTSDSDRDLGIPPRKDKTLERVQREVEKMEKAQEEKSKKYRDFLYKLSTGEELDRSDFDF